MPTINKGIIDEKVISSYYYYTVFGTVVETKI